MKHTSRYFLLLAIVLSLGAASANATIYNITFDPGDPIGGLAAGTTLSTQYLAATGASFSPNAFSGAGGPTGDWATNTGMTIADSVAGDVGGLGTPLLVSGNVLHSFSDYLAEDGDPSFLITFAVPITSFSATFAGMSDPANTQIFGYSGATLLTSTAATATTGQQTLTITTGLAFTSIVVTPGDFNDWVGVDNITFTTVPEPSTWVMLAGGLLLVLVSVRRRLA
jgi:hypothetical protein